MTQAYTRYIKTLRLVLPTFAGLSLLALLIWPWWKEHRDLRLKKVQPVAAPTQTAPASSAPLQVLKPEYQGVDKAGRPYHITAERVEQSIDPKAPLQLIAPQAAFDLKKPEPGDMNPPATPSMTLKATSGLYDTQAQTIDLKGEVTLDYAGYTLKSDDLALDMLSGAASTTLPVTGEGPRGNLSGQMLTIADKGAVIVLKGPSRLVLMPENTPKAMPSPADEATKDR